MVHRIPSYCSSRLSSSRIYIQIHTFLLRPFYLQESSQSIDYHKIVLAAKRAYYSFMVKSSSDCPRRQWNTINNILHRKSSSQLPSSVSQSVLASQFATFFKEKISQLRPPPKCFFSRTAPVCGPIHGRPKQRFMSAIARGRIAKCKFRIPVNSRTDAMQP